MSVLLGWLIIIALSAAVVLGIPKLSLMLSGDRTMTYWDAVRLTLKAFAVCFGIIAAIVGFILLAYYAGSLIGGTA